MLETRMFVPFSLIINMVNYDLLLYSSFLSLPITTTKYLILMTFIIGGYNNFSKC